MRLKDYIKTWEKNKGWEKYQDYKKHKIRFEVCAKNCRGNTFVDVGCAFGHSIIEMKKYREGDWFGIDFFPDVENKVKQYNPDLQVYYSPNYYMLKNIGQRFDSVICSEVLQHVEEHSETLFLKELFNLTKRKLIITIQKIERIGNDSRVYKKEEVADMFKNIDHGKLTIEEGGPFWYVFIMR